MLLHVVDLFSICLEIINHMYMYVYLCVTVDMEYPCQL